MAGLETQKLFYYQSSSHPITEKPLLLSSRVPYPDYQIWARENNDVNAYSLPLAISGVSYGIQKAVGADCVRHIQTDGIISSVGGEGGDLEVKFDPCVVGTYVAWQINEPVQIKGSEYGSFLAIASAQ